MLPDPLWLPVYHGYKTVEEIPEVHNSLLGDGDVNPAEPHIHLPQGLRWVRVDYTRNSSLWERRGYRLEGGLNPAFPWSGMPTHLKLAHQTVGKGQTARNRYQIEFTTVSRNSETGLLGTTAPLKAYVVFDVPVSYNDTDVLLFLYQTLVGALVGHQPALFADLAEMPESNWNSQIAINDDTILPRVILSNEL